MSIVVMGINHRSAPLDVIERVSISDRALPKALHGLVSRDNVRETVVLSTCNRTEVYVVAEKFHAIVLLGMRNSRLKDYFDLYALARTGGTRSEVIADAIAATFARRQTVVPISLPQGLSGQFARDENKVAQWNAFLGKNRLDAPSLEDVVDEIVALLEEPLMWARRDSD